MVGEISKRGKAGNYIYDKEGYTDNQLRLEQAIARALQ